MLQAGDVTSDTTASPDDPSHDAQRVRAAADLLVWLEAPDGVRHGRAMARDGDSYRPHWRRWAEQEEAYVVVTGSGRVRLDDEIQELRQWDLVRVAPGVVRAFEGGPEGLELIAIGNDRPEGGDGEMVEGFWAED